MASIFCPCREPETLTESSIPSLIHEDLCFFSIHALLFCDQCKAVRCPYCVSKEPVSWFCSHCLMETTKLGARESSNRCLRNCLRCPRCCANAVISQHGTNSELVVVNCAACEYNYEMPKLPGETLAMQVVQSSGGRSFPQVLRTVAQKFPAPGAPVNTAAANIRSSQTSGEELPLLVPLRAKFSKNCRSCGSSLSMPSRHAASAQFETKKLARPWFPELRIHKIDNHLRLVARSFSGETMTCTFAPLNANISMPNELIIPPKSSSGFSSPLFLVFRESIESRQAFMAGQRNAKSGPGWAVGEIDLGEEEAREILVFVSVKTGDNGAPVSESLGAWMKISLSF